MNIENTAWVLKYAPIEITTMILDPKTKDYFGALKDIPNNYLFIGLPGAGKTTLAKILARKFAPSSYIFINASDESGIDVVRTKIKDFIETMSWDGAQKIIILDEVDGFSISAQNALRSIMEEYLTDVKFILTGNNKNKITEAIHSRCISVEFPVNVHAVFKRMEEILKLENITLEGDQRKEVAILVKKYFPDIRKTINELQRCCLSGKFIPNNVEEENISTTIIDKLKNKEDVFAIREYVISNESSFNGDYRTLMKHMFAQYVRDKNSSALLLLYEALYRHAIVADPEINFTGLLINLSK